MPGRDDVCPARDHQGAVEPTVHSGEDRMGAGGQHDGAVGRLVEQEGEAVAGEAVSAGQHEPLVDAAIGHLEASGRVGAQEPPQRVGAPSTHQRVGDLEERSPDLAARGGDAQRVLVHEGKLGHVVQPATSNAPRLATGGVRVSRRQGVSGAESPWGELRGVSLLAAGTGKGLPKVASRPRTWFCA